MRSQADIEKMYDDQFKIVNELLNRSLIESTDLAALNRIGKCRLIEVGGWPKCSQAAKAALLSDEHHFVRSSAACESRAPI